MAGASGAGQARTGACPPGASGGPRRRKPAPLQRLVAAIAVCVMAAMMVALSTQYARTYTLARQAARLEQRRRALIAENALLREEIHRLQTDDRYIERIARQQLGLVRPGEIELLIVPAGHGAGAMSAASGASPHPPGAAPAEGTQSDAAAGRINGPAPGEAPAGESPWAARLRAILEWARGWLHFLTPPGG